MSAEQGASVEVDAMEVDDVGIGDGLISELARAAAPGQVLERASIGRLKATHRFKPTNYISNGIEDQVFVFVFKFFVLVCAYKTPKRTVLFRVRIVSMPYFLINLLLSVMSVAVGASGRLHRGNHFIRSTEQGGN
jgi:hypothetical protein